MKRTTQLFLMLLIFMSFIVEGQEEKKEKHSIRTLPIIATNLMVGIISIPLSYEYFIKENTSLEFTTFRLVTWDEMGVSNPYIGFFHGIRFYRSDKRKEELQFWWSPYLFYATNYKNTLGLGKQQYFGIGMSAGLRYHIGKRQTWFVDGGMGFSLNYSIYTNYYVGTNDIYYPAPLPRPTFIIGKKF